ncbi:MAG: hypothetical protein Kow0092_10540 [Deferrisomatales bacterium]
MTQPVTLVSEGSAILLHLAPDFQEPLGVLVQHLRKELSGLEVDWVAVREAYRYGRGRPFPIAGCSPGGARNEKAKIRFSADRLTAYLLLYPPKPRGEKLTEADILRLVRAYGIPDDLLDAQALRMAVLRRAYRDPEPIARGRAPVNGTPARIQWKKGLPSDPSGFLAALKGLGEYPDGVLAEVGEGEPVGVRHPPTTGSPGVAVDGALLPARPGVDSVVLGPGLTTTPDGRGIVAQRAGHLQLSGPGGTSAQVLPLLRVREAQDLLPWNENVLPGSLLVEGDLEIPFPVTILGDVEVRGSVVRSGFDVMGSLFVRDGIIQARGRPIRVGGLVSAAFLERAWTVGRVLHVRRYSLKSRLTALDALLSPRTGTIQGGEIAAARRIAAGTVGTRQGMATAVAVAVPGTVGVFQDLYNGWADRLEASSFDQEAELARGAARRWRTEAAGLGALNPLEARMEARMVHPGVSVRMGTAARKVESSVGPVELAFERFGDRGRIALIRKDRGGASR